VWNGKTLILACFGAMGESDVVSFVSSLLLFSGVVIARKLVPYHYRTQGSWEIRAKERRSCFNKRRRLVKTGLENNKCSVSRRDLQRAH
jgi:hypothetical protein